MKIPLILASITGTIAAPVVAFVAATVATTGAITVRPAAGAPTARGALESLPVTMLRLYATAAEACPGLPWQVLAAIGTVESANGTSAQPGVHRGRNPAGAEGPMQFEPATFAAYALPVPPGGTDPPSPYDPVDAVYAAARMLCADGGAHESTLAQAIYDYNHSAPYVTSVLAVAAGLGLSRGWSGAAGPVALAYALAQVGTPYRWGGEAPGVGFDCSGLTQAAYAAAGVRIPRVAEDQFRAGPALSPRSPLAAGDLVFFGPVPGDATHVGLVVQASGVMVDAPHPGAAVRVEQFDPVVGAAWGSDLYLGATAPAIPGATRGTP